MSPRALITNDDGVDAPGLAALAEAVGRIGYEVVVAAPAQQSSGTSASLTASEVDGRIPMARREAGVHAAVYAVEATPAMIVLLAAHGAFGDRPDVVVSGVNHGANVGRVILHSGTVGAALTAAYHGISALAVSLDVGLEPTGEPQWANAARIAADLIPTLGALPAYSVVNLNVPDADAPVRGVREAHLAPFGSVQFTLAETGDEYLRIQLAEHTQDVESDVDVALLAAGYATVTVIQAIGEVAGAGDLAGPVGFTEPARSGTGEAEMRRGGM